MRRIGGSGLVGAGLVMLAACAPGEDPADLESDAVALEIADGLDPQGKTARAPVTMTCVQPTVGCAPTGYRHATCSLGGLKPNTYVVTCVKGACPAVYGMSNGNGETCFPEQKVSLEGTVRAFFAVRPDATYSFVTRSAGPKAGVVLASATATISSSIGEDTQCGGEPIGCN